MARERVSRAPSPTESSIRSDLRHDVVGAERLLQVLGVAGSAEIYLTWSANERANYIKIVGDHGHLETIDDVVVLKSGNGERRWSCPPPLSQGSHHRDWFVSVAKDFQRAVMGRGRSNLDEAALCARLIDLAQRSSADGGVRLLLKA